MSLLPRVTLRLTKQDTNYRKALEPSLKLAITLRYMASGNSYCLCWELYGFCCGLHGLCWHVLFRRSRVDIYVYIHLLFGGSHFFCIWM